MSPTHADRIAEIMREVSPRLLTQMSTGRVPGLAVGVVNEQGLAWSSGLGAADLASGRRPDERTLFRVASITKTFTAATILQVRDEGRLSLDDPLHRYLPEFRQTPLSDYLLHAPAALERATTRGEFQVRGGRAAGERLTFVFTPEGLADSFSLGGFVYRRLR